MDDDLPTRLAGFRGKGYVIAPAGYGKTHLIATAVKASPNRQLILTHTYAGVNSIKAKMHALLVPASKYKVDTIASWALRLCLAYPASSRWKSPYPQNQEWTALYGACTTLLARPFVQRLVQCSYSGLYVDEYQDCSNQQHTLVSALAALLPCRLLGDPMQAIFDFSDQPVDWERQIYPEYELLGKLTTPHRWQLAGAPDLAGWLDKAGQELRAGRKVSLAGPLPKEVHHANIDLTDFSNPRRLNLFYSFLETDDSVIAIHSGDKKSKNKCHKLAQALGGKFSSIEEVEAKDLFGFIKKLGAARTAADRLLLVIDFAKKCCNGVGDVLSSATKRGDHAKATKATKYPELLVAANQYLVEASSSNLAAFFVALQRNPKTSTYRRDLLNRFMRVLRVHEDNPMLSLTECAHRYQQDFRHSGRPIRHNKLIGTTLLVKGLEYHHAIILEAESMSPKELYVALTRGAKTITIVSLASVLPS